MLLDNKNNGRVGEHLKQHCFENSKLSVLASLFTIHGYASLKKELSQLSSSRLFLSNWQLGDLQSLIGSSEEVSVLNQLNQQRIAKECAKWISGKVEVKASIIPQPLAQNVFHLDSEQECFAVNGSATFTPVGLGDVHGQAMQMNTGISDQETTKQLLQWFNTLWADDTSSRKIKDELIDSLNFIAADQPADFVYYLTLYNIFKDFIQDIDEENIIKGKTGFKDTIVWDKLYKFQKDGVLGAIDKLEKHNGCIIADSVGLGKTFEALAVIKYYELRNDRVLVLCPKKLRDNWTV